LGGLDEYLVARRPAHRFQRFDQRHAGGEHGGQRARPARDGGLFNHRAENRQLEHDPIHEHLHLARALPGLQQGINAATDDAENRPPPFDEKVRDGHHHQGRSRQVGAKAAEQVLERRNHENHDDGSNDECHHDDGNRVEQRRLDLALDAEDFFLVDRQAFEHTVQNTGRFARTHQVAEQRVKIQRVTPKRLGKAAALLDVCLDFQQQPLHRRVGMPARHDFERLQQRHPGLHHGRQLAGEQGDILVGDALAARKQRALLLDLGDGDALLAQQGIDHGFAAGHHLAFDLLPALVHAFPQEGGVLDCLCRCSHTENSLDLRYW